MQIFKKVRTSEVRSDDIVFPLRYLGGHTHEKLIYAFSLLEGFLKIKIIKENFLYDLCFIVFGPGFLV